MTLCCSEYAFTMCTYTGEGMGWVWRGSCVFAWSGLTWTFSLYELWMFKSYLESKLSQEACISAETEIDWLYLGLRSWFLYWSLQLSSHERHCGLALIVSQPDLQCLISDMSQYWSRRSFDASLSASSSVLIIWSIKAIKERENSIKDSLTNCLRLKNPCCKEMWESKQP